MKIFFSLLLLSTISYAKEKLKIISLTPAVTQTIIDLGARANIIGISRYCPKPNNEAQIIGDYYYLNYEAVTKLAPSITFLSFSQTKAIKFLKKNNFSYQLIKTNNVKDIINSIELIGSLINAKENAKKIVNKIKTVIKKVTKASLKLQRKTVLIILGTSKNSQQYYIVGREQYYSEILTYLNAKNIYQGNQKYPQVSVEGLIALNPDIIIILSNKKKEEIIKKEKEQWKKYKFLKAIKNNQFFYLNQPSLILPGSSLDKAIKILANTIHPNLIIKKNSTL